MTTDIFICWSGDRSKAIAKAFSEKLGEATGAETFYSPEIEPGRLWFPQVREKLAAARAGILCITMENVGSPWLHYEAGFLSSGLVAGEGRPRDPEGVIFPYLFKVSPEAIQGGPLAAFQAVEATPEGTRRLI
ncbi:MAG: TIR domain-containing protein, partial [Gemmatimonadota bacterium]|nr:TIR domain-containing protein [Gemmatimonadota bacterium]